MISNIDDSVNNEVKLESEESKLLTDITKIYLKVSKELQRVAIWTDEKKNEWKRLFENTLKNDLKVIYGYFVEYEPRKEEVIYFIDTELAKKDQGDTSFQPPYIPYFLRDTKRHEELFQHLYKQHKKFDNPLETPKLYQHLPIQPKSKEADRGDYKLISDKCLNCHIPCEIKEESDYYVVLFDEVIFFQFAYCYISLKRDILKIYQDQKILLTYLLKFAAGYEIKVKRNSICDLLDLTDEDRDNWNNRKILEPKKKILENDVRNKIKYKVQENINDAKWKANAFLAVKDLVDYMIDSSVKNPVFGENSYESLDRESVLNHIARFDIEASFMVVNELGAPEYHDVFVFPIYTEAKPIFTTECIQGTKLDVHSPILLVLYIKTLYVISKEDGIVDDYDEDRSSVNGFQFTKEITKLFAQKLIQEEYLENVFKLRVIPPSIRAAISQVMARNMSHNIGSHVLNNLTDGAELSKNEIVKCTAYKPAKELENLGDDSKIIYQLAIYNNYVKCRMDYLSDITFGVPVMQTNKKVYGELYKDFDKVRLLLEHISGLSKNFPYEIKIQFSGIELSEETDRTIALPNDILGSQAFYNILENIIRNTAKHNQEKGGNLTTFTINISEIKERSDLVPEAQNIFYQVEVYDSIAVIGYKEFKDEEKIKKDEYLKKKGIINKKAVISKIDWLVYEQNEKLNLSVLDENNQLRNSALGLLEMKASAAYLRKMDVIDIESKEYHVIHDEGIYTKDRLNILKAFAKDNCLGYKFFISKPTEYLFIGDFDITEEWKRELNKMGIWIRNEATFIEQIPKTIFNHQFVLYQSSDAVKEHIENFKTHLPLRVIEIDKNNTSLFNLIKEEKSFDKIEGRVWQQWFETIKGNYSTINVFAGYQSKKHNQNNRYNLAFSNHLDTWDISDGHYSSGNINFLDALSSNAQRKLPDSKNRTITDYIFDEAENVTLHIMLFEAAINKVLVIDERIQRYAGTTYDSHGVSILNKIIFQHTNVEMPDSDPYILDADDYDPELIGLICGYINTEVKKNKFLLIHYSILERLFGSKHKRINEHLEAWAKETRVIVTSGRGKPKELPRSVCYVNLSPILNVFTQTRSKYSINYLLNQARV